MAWRICTICGKELSSAVTVCPRCSQALSTSSKNIFVDLRREHLKLYEYLLPAAEDPEKLSIVEYKIKQYLEKYKTLLSHRAYDLLCDTLFDSFREAESQWKYKKEVDRQTVNNVLASVNAAMNQQSTYKGMGFSVITDAAGVAAYAAVDAVQGHIHDVTQSLAAYKKALNDISVASQSSDRSRIVQPIFKAIDRLVAHLAVMVDSKKIVDAHRDLYNTCSSDLKIGGKYVLSELCQAAKGQEFVGQLYGSGSMHPYQLMEAAGYIHLFYHRKGVALHFCTTGKLEAEMLQSRFLKDHPEMAAAEKKAIAESNQMHCTQAELALQKHQYYRAAARYAQTDGDRDALRRSMRIWEQYLLKVPEMERGHFLGVDGDAKYMYFTTSGMDIPFDKKLCDECVKYRQIHWCADEQYVGLSVDGRVYSSAKNIYGERKLSKSEIGTAYLPGNGKDWTNITAIACSGDHLVGLRKDGTVCAIGCNTHGQCSTEGWKDVVSVEAEKNSTAGIKKDGTVLLAGAIAEYASEVSKWRKMKCLYLRGEGIIGLDVSGQVTAAGKTGFDNQAISRWRSIVRINWFDDGIFGINEAGDVQYDNSDPVTELLCRRLSGIVKIVYFSKPQSYSFEKRPSIIALRADGTVYTSGMEIDLSDWSEIVYLDHHENHGPNLLAIHAKGRFLFHGSEFSEFNRDEKPFSHIDTYADDWRHTLEEVLAHKKWMLGKAKGPFAGKQRKALQVSIDFLQKEIAKVQA